MTKNRKIIRKHALENAAEFIRGHVESGISEEELGMDIELYHQECQKIADMLMKKAERIFIKQAD